VDISPVAIVIMLVCAAGSFALGRWLSRGRRAKRREKEIAAARASETRQQRRARERRERG
jgi:type II secretory pathway pseudopilin PulG